MESLAAAPTDVAAQLTGAALRLLDVTFEPAAVCSGERFDLVVEALSDQLSDTATALLATAPPPPFRAPELPQIAGATTRRAGVTLRRAVEEGTLPGSGRSLTTCRDDLLDVERSIRDLVSTHPQLASTAALPCADAVGRLARVVSTYAHGYARVAAALARPGCSREAAADAAARTERALVRCLDRCGDTRALR